MAFIKENGIAYTIKNLAKNGTMIIGICSGYQMLGKEIRDSENAESRITQIGGLSLIDAKTIFMLQKNTYQIKARLHGSYASRSDLNNFNTRSELTGYEIHMGETELLNGTLPFLKIIERSYKEVCVDDGAISNDGNVIGTYVHGIFDNDEFRLELINCLRRKKCLSPIQPEDLSKVDKERQYDKLADLFRKNIKMDLIFEQIGDLKDFSTQSTQRKN